MKTILSAATATPASATAPRVPGIVRAVLCCAVLSGVGGCEAIYTHHMDNGKESCWRINDAARRSECLKYYSTPYERYEEDARRAGDAHNKAAPRK